MTGNKLKRTLDEMGITQKEAAEYLGVSSVTICRNIAKGTERISDDLSKSVIEMSIKIAYVGLQQGLKEMNDLMNQIAYLGKV